MAGRSFDPLDEGCSTGWKGRAHDPGPAADRFLGSGKTTLLQRLLADPALSDAAVLINEFGEVGLDHHLLDRIDEGMSCC